MGEDVLQLPAPSLAQMKLSVTLRLAGTGPTEGWLSVLLGSRAQQVERPDSGQ